VCNDPEPQSKSICRFVVDILLVGT
jgi:hypothetical protein